MKLRNMGLAAAALAGVGFMTVSSAVAAQVKITISNNAQPGGVAITPVWVGFHDGSFDSYNGGLSSQPGLEQIAETGSSAIISDDFANGRTYIDNSGGMAVSDTVDSSQPGSERVQGDVGSAPIGPGGSASLVLDVDTSGPNQFFSYVSMVLPSNDYYIANGNPVAHDVSSLVSIGDTPITFNIGVPGAVNDAGTEVNDFLSSAGNGLFPSELPDVPNSPGTDENGVNHNVTDPYANFLNQPADLDTLLPGLDFNDSGLYPNGIATVTIEVIPEPASLALLSIGFAGLLRRRRK